MNGFMIAFVTVMAVTFNVAAGQNTSLSCSQEDIAEHNRLVDELNSGSCDPCNEEEIEPDDCRCCAIYSTVLDLQKLCEGNDNKRSGGNVLNRINDGVKAIIKKYCAFYGIGGASTIVAGATVIAFTAIAATIF